MKKTMVMMVMTVMALVAVAEPRLAAVSANQAAMTGANYEMELNFTDLTPTTADIAQTNTFTVYGPAGLRWEGAVLETDFNDNLGDATTNDVSWTLLLGSTTLVNAAKVSTDQTTTTRVWMPGTYSSGSVTIAATNVATAVTFTASNYAIAASGGTITVTSILAPSGGSPLASMKAGRLRCYFKKL
jgi:hypothetical protein